MEAGAAFLLLLIVIFVGIVGGGLWLLTSTLRRRKLNPERDEIDARMLASRAGDAGAVDERSAEEDEAANGRPEHSRVSNEQHSRSIPRQ